MPIEAIQLIGQPVALLKYPKCEGTLEATPYCHNEPFMRGMVQRNKYVLPWIWRIRPYCAVICPHCKDIMDWEMPFDNKHEDPSHGPGPYRRSTISGDPICGATGDLIHTDQETGARFCLACLVSAAADSGKKCGGISFKNAKEIRERIRLAKQGVELPPWEQKVSTEKNKT